ncbi:MAG: GcrA family cell cycle regulator [Pseudomonadota bacterium]
MTTATTYTDADIETARREGHHGWTDTRRRVVKGLWKDGFSAAQIATRIGGTTRNAVLGIIHRAGVADRPTTSKPSRPAAPRPVRAPVAPPVKRATHAGQPPKPTREVAAFDFRNEGAEPSQPNKPPSLPPERNEAPGSATVLSLGAHMCKWPIGDPAREGFTFCGRRQDPGRVYCREHCQVAYQQPKQTTNTVRNLSAPSVGRSRTFNTVSR